MNVPAKLTTCADSSAGGCDLVRQWLREHNWTANAEFMCKLQLPEHQAVPLVVIAESDAGVVGGLMAETQLAWLRISIMAVDPRFRSQGIGSSLLAEAERQALARGCRHIYVDTMAYQAPGFYLRHGYRMVGEIPDWDSQGHAKHFLTKELIAKSSSMNSIASASGRPRVQQIVLRIVSLASLLALPAVVLPRLAAEKVSWIMGFGQPPMTPLMLYMMAGGAAVYFGQAVLLWTISNDVVRYQPLVRLVAWIYLICVPTFCWIDTQAGLPRWWLAMDCLGSLAAGSTLMWACCSRKS